VVQSALRQLEFGIGVPRFTVRTLSLATLERNATAVAGYLNVGCGPTAQLTRN
jgi:hypothetical protein